MGLYDPLSLVSLALLHRKLLLRRLYGPHVKGGWDTDLPAEEKRLWVSWFKTLLLLVEAIFPDSTRPSCAGLAPRLVGFGDASMMMLCVTLYVVWTDQQRVHHPRILTCKRRVAPLLGTTFPWGELQALGCSSPTGCYCR